MALHGLPVAIHSGGGGPDRSQPVQNEIGEKLFWTRLSRHDDGECLSQFVGLSTCEDELQDA